MKHKNFYEVFDGTSLGKVMDHSKVIMSTDTAMSIIENDKKIFLCSPCDAMYEKWPEEKIVELHKVLIEIFPEIPR